MKQNFTLPSRKWNLLKVFVLICTTLASTLSFGQAGNAPMQALPNFPGPFAVDGFLQRQGVNGDWLAGPGGATNRVFTDAGVPLVPLAYLLTDLYNDLINDDIFDGGNKLFQNPNDWGWRSQKPPGKDDINNAMVFLAINPADSHIWLAISGDRMETNGTSYLDFEFYQNTITKTGGPIPGGTGGFNSTGPANGRTVGDISITLEYTGGGSFATVKYLQWQPGAEAGSYDYFPVTPVPGTAYAAANGGAADINVPYGAFGINTYHTLQFVEGAIDLTALIGGTGLPGECGSLPFKTLFIKSKSSAERTADLKDFISPFQLNVCFDHTAPVINCPATLNLGCNPTIPGPSGGTASDNCNGAITPVASDGPVQSNGCARTMIRTWRAQDACGNTTSCGQTINWTEDHTAPSLTTGGTTTALGCNPSAGDINGALGSASASDACGAPTLSSSDGSVSSDGCSRSQTRSWTARDGCGNTSTAARTVTWTADVTPPTLTTGGGSLTLGCNPSAGDINGALGTASATDACGNPTVSSSDGSVQSNGCSRSQTRTFTARDACGNTSTASRTATWTADVTPPAFTGDYSDVVLGCNPADPAGSLGGASASDACGAPTITFSDGAVGTNGCLRSQTRTFTARDGCNNTSTVSRTVRWTSDVTPPAFTGSYSNVVLGCNPAASDITNALDGATATDACGAPTISQSDGSVGSTGCSRSQTRTFTARDGCGNTSTVSRTVNWTSDNTPPTFTGSYATVNLGCNPIASDVNGALGSASATDACGPVTITQSDGAITTSACGNSQIRTFTARDGCGNTATVSRTVNWGADATPPTFTGNYNNVTLGCNPTSGDITTALDGATATDACGPTTVTQSDGSVSSNGCSRSQTRTFTARDACGNTATISRSVSWTADQTPPTINANGTGTSLGCNPSSGDINAALGSASATDACGPTTVTQIDGAVGSDGCSRSQTRTFTARDGCGNTATTSRTVNWTSDVTPPTFTGSYTNVSLGCNPTSTAIATALDGATATDACSTPTVSQSDGAVQSNGCSRSQTRTFTARDGCGNTATISRTVSWTSDVTPPTFTNVPASADLDCGSTVGEVGTATATDACGTPTVSLIGNTDVAADCSTGFNRVVTRTWRATDACGNTSTASQTIRVKCCPTAFCTYTQGAYGTDGGAMCDGTNGGWTTLQFINNVLDNYGGSFSVGKPGRSVTVNSAQCVIDKLPGGGGAKELVPGDVNLCNFTPLQPNGGVKNILLAQTITLKLNLGIENSLLSGFVLKAGELATADPVGGCGDKTPKTRICHYNTLAPYNLTSVENEYTYRTFTQEVIDAIPGAKTVGNLLELANRALANVDGVVGSENGVSLDAINTAVSYVNEVFDQCKLTVGWDVSRCPAIDPTPGDGRVAPTTVTSETLVVTAYPNPYQENFSLKVNSPVSGQATIGFYTIDGVKIGEMKRDVVAKRDVWVPFNVPAVYRTRIVYTVAVGSYNAKGVVLSPN